MKDMPNDDYEVKHYVAMDAGTAMLMPLMPWVILVIAVAVVAFIADFVAGVKIGPTCFMVFCVCPLIFFIGYKSPYLKRIFALQTMYVFLSMGVQSIGCACMVYDDYVKHQHVYTDFDVFSLLGYQECHTNILWIIILVSTFAFLSILFVIFARKLNKYVHLTYYIIVALVLLGLTALFLTLKTPNRFTLGKTSIYFSIKAFIFAILNVVLGIVLVKKTQ